MINLILKIYYQKYARNQKLEKHIITSMVIKTVRVIILQGNSLSLPLNCFRGLLFVFFATGCIFQTGVEILRSSEKYLLCLVGEYLLRNSNQKKVSFVVMIQLSTQPYALLEIRTLQIFHIQVIVKPRTWEIYSKLTIESMVESMTENTSTTLHVNQNI